MTQQTLIAEPSVDLIAQMGDLLAPAHARFSVLVTESRPALAHVTAGLAEIASVERDGATLFVHMRKAPMPREMLALFGETGLEDEEALALLLAYTKPKSALRLPVSVLQVQRGGVVVWEQMVDQSCVQSAWARAERYGGERVFVHPCDVLIRRLQHMKRETLNG